MLHLMGIRFKAKLKVSNMTHYDKGTKKLIVCQTYLQEYTEKKE